MSPGEAIALDDEVRAQQPNAHYRFNFYRCGKCGYVHAGHRRATADEIRATKREARRRNRKSRAARRASA